MAQREEPLYDFPEPSQASKCKLLGAQRGRGSLRSISVLDRLLLTVPVWLQLSINPATALHILQREPPGVRATYIKNTHTIHTHCMPLAFSFHVCTHTRAQWSVVLSCRTSWCVSLAHPIETCCVSVWWMRACRPSFSSLASGRNTPVRVSFKMWFLCLNPNTQSSRLNVPWWEQKCLVIPVYSCLSRSCLVSLSCIHLLKLYEIRDNFSLVTEAKQRV